MMAESFPEVVAARRRWKIIAMALLVALVGSLAVNARADLPFPERVKARIVEAEEIVLKDSEGQVRARLATNQFPPPFPSPSIGGRVARG